MTTNYLDRYGRSRSVCHRLPTGVKLFATVAVITIGLSLPAEKWPAFGALASLVLIGHSLARIPLAYLGRRLAIFLPMVLLFSLSVPLSQGFRAGWEIMAKMFLGSTLAFLSLLWLVNVMPFDQLLVTLRRLRVPDVFVATLAFMYRYTFVLWDELDKMRTARRARTFGSPGFGLRWKVSTQLIGMLLIRAMAQPNAFTAAKRSRLGWPRSRWKN
jgi:cobalt/nickel transport system permease protein